MLAAGLLFTGVILIGATVCALRIGERPIAIMTLAAASWGVLVAGCLAALIGR